MLLVDCSERDVGENKSALRKCLGFVIRTDFHSRLWRQRGMAVLLSLILSICLFCFICNIRSENNTKRFHVEDCVTWGGFCSAVTNYYCTVSEDAKENIELAHKNEKMEFTAAMCRLPLTRHDYVHFFNDGVIWFESNDVIPYMFSHEEKVIDFWDAKKEIRFVPWEKFHELMDSLEKEQNSLLSFSAEPSLTLPDHWQQFRRLFKKFPKEKIVHIYSCLLYTSPSPRD